MPSSAPITQNPTRGETCGRGSKESWRAMSKPRYSWWGYVKAIIRRYAPDREQELHGVSWLENNAVRKAVSETKSMQDGEERLKFIRLVFWEKTHTLEGAAMAVNCSDRTARRWHADFIKCVARNYGLLDD